MKFSIVVFLALVVVITAIDYEEDTFALCEDQCKDDSYNPVCAVDVAGHRRTFNNDCHLAKFNCKSTTKWRKKLDKKCG